MKKIIEYFKDNPSAVAYAIGAALLFCVWLFVLLVSLACLSPVTVTQISSEKMPSAPMVEPTDSASPIAPIAPTATLQADGHYTVCANVNVRSVPAAAGPVLEIKYKDQSVTVIEWVGGWAKIGEGMYLNGKYLCGNASRE